MICHRTLAALIDGTDNRGDLVRFSEIAEKAGVGVGTIYRNFPQRSDLIAAVFRSEVDACADAAASLAKAFPAGEALDRWMQRYVDFIVAKRGLAAALHSGDPAFEALPAYFDSGLSPRCKGCSMRPSRLEKSGPTQIPMICCEPS